MSEFIDKFASRFMRVSGTYEIIVEMHFWWGLMIIGILLGARTNGAGILDLVSRDPLGVLLS